MQPLRGSRQVYLSCGFSPDGLEFAAGGIGHIVERWNLADLAKDVTQIDTDGIPVTFVNYTPAGDLVIARMRGALHFKLRGSRDVVPTWLSPSLISQAAITADGTRLVTAGDSLTVWEVGREYDLLLDISTGLGEVFTAAAIAPDRRQFASARLLVDGGSVVELWDLVERNSYRQFQPNGTRVGKLAWSPDGRFLAGLVDKHLTIWDVATTDEVFGPLPNPEQGDLLSIAFHPFANQLITGSTSGVVSCWDLNSFRQRTSYRWDLGPIYALAFAFDGLRAAAAGHGAIILWDFDA